MAQPANDEVPAEIMNMMNGMMSQLAVIENAHTDEERQTQYEVLADMLARTEQVVKDEPATPAAPAQALPQLFVLGDSISIQYGPYLKVALQGVFDYSRKNEGGDAHDNSLSGQNGGSSADALEYLKTLPKRQSGIDSWALLNAGLWDVRRDRESGTIQVPLQQYRANVRAILELAREKGFAHIYWVRTTHVDDQVHATRSDTSGSDGAKAIGYMRKQADVELYNDVADEVCADCGVRTIDLSAASADLGESAFKDHVHFTPDVAGQQAGIIAGVLMALM